MGPCRIDEAMPGLMYRARIDDPEPALTSHTTLMSVVRALWPTTRPGMLQEPIFHKLPGPVTLAMSVF